MPRGQGELPGPRPREGIRAGNGTRGSRRGVGGPPQGIYIASAPLTHIHPKTAKNNTKKSQIPYRESFWVGALNEIAALAPQLSLAPRHSAAHARRATASVAGRPAPVSRARSPSEARRGCEP